MKYFSVYFENRAKKNVIKKPLVMNLLPMSDVVSPEARTRFLFCVDRIRRIVTWVEENKGQGQAWQAVIFFL